MTIFLAVTCAALLANDPHEQRNPVYRELRLTGVNVGADKPARMPEPLMAGGLAAREQEKILRELIRDQFDYSTFTRKSTVAPEKLVLRDVPTKGPKSATRRIQVICVAYGDLPVIANKEFLDRVLDLNRNEGKAGPISPEELKKRGLEVKDAKHEGYGHVVLSLLDKVELDVSTHSYWSQTEDSIVAAGRIDPRFRDDKEFPNRWRSLTKLGDGTFKKGKSFPYDGAGYYVKFTKLARPQGALFVEGHVIFQEPIGWFDGANFLRSKLPPVIQKQVRTFRQELLRSSK